MRCQSLVWLWLVCGCGSGVSAGAPDLAPSPSPLAAIDKVDILFMLDDSPGVRAVNAVQARFGDLVAALDQFPSQSAATSFHIGVVTSNLGSAQSTACPHLGGLGGRLQPLGKAHGAGCIPPTNGLNFIDYDQISNTNNLPTGVTLADEFTCMASVGSDGCGFEMPLEAVYKALSDTTITENAGFLRDDAVLAVIWVTDEDDCSAPPDTDLFDADKSATYGPLDSYRCTNYGVMCGNPPHLMPYGDSGGPLDPCEGATAAVGGKLYEVSRYIDYFTKPGGVKADPRRVILASIAAPPTPVASVLMNPMTGAPCTVIGADCAVSLQHSCNASADFFGDPAVRLSQLVHSTPNFIELTLCAPDYTPFMQQLGAAILKARLGQ